MGQENLLGCWDEWDDTDLHTQAVWGWAAYLSDTEASRNIIFFTSERVRNILFLWNLKAKVGFELATGSFSHCTRVPALQVHFFRVPVTDKTDDVTVHMSSVPATDKIDDVTVPCHQYLPRQVKQTMSRCTCHQYLLWQVKQTMSRCEFSMMISTSKFTERNPQCCW